MLLIIVKYVIEVAEAPLSIYKKHFQDLKNLLSRKKALYTDLTDGFFLKNLLTKSELDAVNSKLLSNKQRSSKVVHALHDSIKDSDDPGKCLKAICEVLEDENIEDKTAKTIAADIRTDLQVIDCV